MKFLGLAAAAAVAWAGAVHANAFDDCVLKTMQGVTSDAAAQSIKEAECGCQRSRRYSNLPD